MLKVKTIEKLTTHNCAITISIPQLLMCTCTDSEINVFSDPSYIFKS